jgi:hypothetical protein
LECMITYCFRKMSLYIEEHSAAAYTGFPLRSNPSEAGRGMRSPVPVQTAAGLSLWRFRFYLQCKARNIHNHPLAAHR